MPQSRLIKYKQGTRVVIVTIRIAAHPKTVHAILRDMRDVQTRYPSAEIKRTIKDEVI